MNLTPQASLGARGYLGKVSTAAALLDLLAASGRPYALLDHPEAVSAEAAAAARGTPLEIGGKSVLMSVEKLGFVVLVVGSDRRVEGKLLRKALGVQRYRFASPEELLALTGLRPGAVPAFARPLFDAELVVGEDVAARPEIAFAAASSTRSVRMATADWLAVARPRVIPAFTGPATP